MSSSLISSALKKMGENNLLPSPTSKIAVAMSGGVDSSVSAALMNLAGYEVIGLTGWLMAGKGKCCDGGMLDSAKVAEKIGIEHESVDLRELFSSTIINPFISAYKSGKTPVPCMPCNTEVKWGSLLDYSKTLGASHLASGHYSRLLKNQTYFIGQAKDLNKDQSYMLWGLNQAQLERIAFPLANFTKTEVRELAEALDLNTWNKEESQDICFIPDSTKNFLLEKLGERKGEIRHFKTNEILGEHSGTHLFTIGQRKGIGVSNTEPLFVIKLDPINNIVFVGEKADLFSKTLFAEGANWQKKPNEKFKALIKIRYNSPCLPALIELSPTEDSFKASFLEEEGQSVTPGQAAVIYSEENEIIGGGWITDRE